MQFVLAKPKPSDKNEPRSLSSRPGRETIKDVDDDKMNRLTERWAMWMGFIEERNKKKFHGC